MLDSCCARSSRFGRRSRKLLAGSAAGLRRFSIGPGRGGIGKAKTRRVGAATSTTCCRSVARSAASSIAALPYSEIGAFMAALRQQEGIAARALEFAILTAARTGEVIGARWAEI